MFVTTQINNENTMFMVRFDHSPYNPAKPKSRRCCTCKIYELGTNTNPLPYSSQFGALGSIEEFKPGTRPMVSQKRLIAEDLSECNEEDNYNKAFGCLLSLRRALEQLIYCYEGNYTRFTNENYQDFIRQLYQDHPVGMSEAKKLMTKDYICPEDDCTSFG